MNVHEELKAYVDGELNPEQRAAVEDAASKDPSIRRQIDELRRLSRMVSDGLAVPTPVGLERTLDSLSKANKPKARWGHVLRSWPFWQFAAASALVALIVVPIIYVSKGAEKEDGATMRTASYTTSSEHLDKKTNRQNGELQATEVGKAADSTADSATDQAPVLDGEVDSRSKGSDNGGSQTYDVVPRHQTIRSGELTISVPNVPVAQANAIEFVKSLSGVVESTTLDNPSDRSPSASVSVRVPERDFENAMDRLSQLGDVRSRSISDEEVDNPLVAVLDQLANLQKEEEQYEAMLEKAKSVDDSLEIRDRLARVRNGIADLKTKKSELLKTSATATIRLSLRDSDSERPGSHEQRRLRSSNAMLIWLPGIAAGILLSWWWLSRMRPR